MAAQAAVDTDMSKAHNECGCVLVCVCVIHWLAWRESLLTDKPGRGPAPALFFFSLTHTAQGPPYLLEMDKLAKTAPLQPQ